MANSIIVNLDTSKNQYNISECKQNDDLILEANIFENGIEKDISTYEIIINCTRSDETFIIQNTDITKTGNKIIANLDRGFTRVDGLDRVEIVLLKNGKQNTTFDFNILVKPSVIKGAVESENNATILEKIEIKIEEATSLKEGLTTEITKAAAAKTETEQLIATGNAATKADIATVNSHLEQNENKIKSNYFYNLNEFKYWAHRGASNIAPENTIPAFEIAGDLGFWGIETDTTVTKDGKWVIIHDDTVDSMTDGTGLVSEKTLDEIKSLNIISGKNVSRYEGCKIPTLQEYLEVCKKYNVIPIIEMKWKEYTNENYDEFAKIIKQYNIEDRCIVTCFHDFILGAIVKRLPNITIGKVYSGYENDDILKIGEKYKKVIVCIHYSGCTKENIDKMHSAGLKVSGWTVDIVENADIYINNGIDFLYTNNLV